MGLLHNMIYEGANSNSLSDVLDSILEEDFGELKIDRPTGYGLNTALDAERQYADASDGEDTDIELSIDKSFSFGESTVLDEDFDSILEEFDGEVDPATIPAVNSELDQYEAEDDNTSINDLSAEELSVDESTIDLFDFDIDEDLY